MPRLIDHRQNGMLAQAAMIVMATPFVTMLGSGMHAGWRAAAQYTTVPRLLTEAFNKKQVTVEIDGRRLGIATQTNGNCTIITAHERFAVIVDGQMTLRQNIEPARIDGIVMSHTICTKPAFRPVSVNAP